MTFFMKSFSRNKINIVHNLPEKKFPAISYYMLHQKRRACKKIIDKNIICFKLRIRANIRYCFFKFDLKLSS